jgi:hypothetical protein
MLTVCAHGTSKKSLHHRHNTALTTTAACVTPILYLLFVSHYSTDALQNDEWSMVPFLHEALHGHFSMGQLWSQHNAARVPLIGLYLLLFALADHLDVRAAIFCSGLVYTAAYVILLGLCRKYRERRLTPIPVLIIGVVWFSLADTQNALWAFQVGWFLVMLAFVAMLYALLVAQGHRTLWFALAVFAAVVATLSQFQGFLLWPVGILCILWARPRVRRTYNELAIWIGSILAIICIYLVGYDFSMTGCSPYFGCTPTSAVSHPLTTVRVFIVLIGNVIPGTYRGNGVGSLGGQLLSATMNPLRFELLGVALLGAAIFVIIQSWRHRTEERLPLPLLLIGFALLFDVTVAWGRVGGGVAGAVEGNRYVLPNLVLLIGLVLYAWSHVPPRPVPKTQTAATCATWGCFLALAVVLVLQATVSTGFGINSGRETRRSLTESARLADNMNRLPDRYRSCELEHYVIVVSDLGLAAEDHLSEFRPSAYRTFRQLGPPPLLTICTRRAAGP